jgi:branched-chain amino acid transport system ATP-binding protein
MVPKAEGSILLDGEPMPRSPKAIVKRGIVQVPEGRRIFPSITVRENLLLGAYTIRDKETIERGLERAYSLFPILGERESQMGGTLSGGQQQMLAIARALMAQPKTLLLDEPSLGLAPMLVLEIFDLVRRLNDEGLTILLVEQNATKALALADYAYVLETGRVVAEGKGEDISGDPVVKKAYLGVR